MRSPLRGLPREVGALVGVAFFVAVGFGVLAPAIPLLAREFGVSKTAAGAVTSVFALARLGTAPFIGRLVDAFGERKMLATGIGIVAVSSALAGLSQVYWQLLVLRGVGGIGSIMFTVSSISLLIRVTPAPQRGRAQGVYAGGFLLGSIAGPAVGVVASISLRAPFFLYAGLLVVAGAVGLVMLGGASGSAARTLGGPPAVTLGAAFRDSAYRGALAATLAGQWAVIGVRTALVPLFTAEALHASNAWTYVSFFVVSIVSGVLLAPAGRYADTRGRRPVLLVGLAVGAAGLLVLTVVESLPGLIASMVLLGVAGAALSVAPGAIVGDVVGGRGGTVVATFQMAGDLGSIIGPLVGGALADGYGYGAAFGFAALVTLLPIAVVGAARETLPRAEPADAVDLATGQRSDPAAP